MPPWVWMFSFEARWNASVAETRAAAAAIGSSAALAEGVRAGKLGRHVNIGELVLDRLKGSDRPPEGVTLGRVGPCHVQAGLRPADLLEGDEHGGPVEQHADQVEALPGGAERLGRDIFEHEFCLVAGGIEASERSSGHAGIAQVDHIERRIARAVGRDHGEIGDLAVRDRQLGAAQLPVLYARLDAHAIGIAGAFRKRQGADALARHELR
jgi:hypothetical protein